MTDNFVVVDMFCKVHNVAIVCCELSNRGKDLRVNNVIIHQTEVSLCSLIHYEA